MKERATGDRFVIGSNHVLAGVNQSTLNRDRVRQPGAGDGGTLADVFGTLVDYVPIKLGGYYTNEVDAALAELDDTNDVERGIRSIGDITGVAAPLSYGDRVKKMGWRTQYTEGTFRYKVDFETEFVGIGKATFVNQYGVVGDDATTGFALLGDSGAGVLTESADELAGIVIGVADGLNLTLVSPIDPVLRTFGVEPVL
ncbi:MAG: S1 family peptidase [Actinomycetota bacterium]|nr:S1 family peptidase [Actinomycetota bacterium]